MNVPKHIAVIPDGNRRWARRRGLLAFLGHEEGAKRLEDILDMALELKIPYFTFWGASVDNMTGRPKKEVNFLFKVFEKYFDKLLQDKKIDENRVRVRILGRWQEFFPRELQDVCKKIIKKTKDYKNCNLTFLMAYSGIDEMLQSVSKIADLTLRRDSGRKIDAALIKQNLWTNELPAVDLVIRTGGEPHWSSGFMMWDTSDAQLYFTETFWPDFRKAEFKKAIEESMKRERRFGE